MEYIHLTGVEDIQRAAEQMTRAALRMEQAAQIIDNSNASLIRYLDNWIAKFEEIFNK